MPSDTPSPETSVSADKRRVLMLAQQRDFVGAKSLCARLCAAHAGDAEAWFLLGAVHGQLGEFAQAAECCRRSIALHPGAAVTHYNLGIALHRLGQYEEAVTSFREAVRRQPDYAEAWHDLGNALLASGRHDEALESYRKAVAIKPGFATAHMSLAGACLSMKRHTEAAAGYQRALELDPDLVDARYRLAEMFHEQGKIGEAVEQYRAALRQRPDEAAAHANLGHLLYRLKDLSAAEESYQAALRFAPAAADVWCSLGTVQREQDRLDVAEASYREALRLDPDLATAHNNLGLVLHATGRLDEAMPCYRRALEIRPDLVEAHVNSAKLFRDQCRLDQAASVLDDAIRILPDAAPLHCDRALVRLQQGDFARGWEEYEWRWRSGSDGLIRREFSLPQWDGSPLTGKCLLIHAEQGIGDEIMFASCLPDVIARARHVIVDCEPRLAPVFRRSFPGITVHGGKQRDGTGWLADYPGIDWQIPIGSLPRFFRKALAEFPRHAGYLKADPALVEMWRSRYAGMGPGLKTGISWRGGYVPEIKKRRSTTLDQWIGALRIPGIHVINLQYGDTADEIHRLGEQGVHIRDWADSDPLKDLDHFAAKIAALDLVVSVDNATVHMAGALGVPVWVLQPYSPDWRWMIDREDCCWYPSLRQIRQPCPDDWATVFAKVAQELAQLIHAHTR